MKIKEKSKIFVIATLLVCALFFFLSWQYLHNQFEEKSKAISENIATNITMLEEEMEKTLAASAIVVQEKFFNDLPFTNEKLSKLASDLGITTISILNGKDGFFYMTSGKVFSKEDKGYQGFSVLDVEQCGIQMCGDKLCRNEVEIKNCKMKRSFALMAVKNPDQILEIPMYSAPIWKDKKVNIASKWVIVYNKRAGKIFDLFYSNSDITKILENNIKIHHGYLTYISITDSEGNLIAEAGVRTKKGKEIKLPFGKDWNFKVEGRDVKYSYILNTEFGTKELMYQSFILIGIFIFIVILIILLVLTLKLKIDGNEKGIQILKDMIREKSKKK